MLSLLIDYEKVFKLLLSMRNMEIVKINKTESSMLVLAVALVLVALVL